MSSIRTLLVVVIVAAAGLIALAVWQDRSATRTVSAPAFVEGDVIAVEGCLTASGAGAFALTPVDRDPLTSAMTSRSGATTYTYELVGGAAELRPFVGQRVRVRGRASDPGADVDLDRGQTTPPAGQARDSDARVGTRMEAEIEVRRLDVESVENIPGTCPQPDDGSP